MIKIIQGALRMRGVVVLMIPALIAMGIYTYVTMPRDAFPDISPVMVPIFAEAPGLAAEEVELMIALPIESAMNGLPDVTLVKSTSSFGLGVVYVYFKDSVDIYFARQLVSERLRSADALLPPDIPQPELGPISSGLGEIFVYYLKADPARVDAGGRELNTYLRELNEFVVKRQLQTVPGVTAILSMGGYVPQYQIRLNPDAMQSHDITFDEIAELVAASNRNTGGQYVEIGAEEYLIRGVARLTSVEDLKNITLRDNGGVPLKLDRVAEVSYGPEPRRGAVSRNGSEEVVAGLVMKLYGENTSKVVKALHRKLEDVARILPAGVEIIPFYDQANLVNSACRTVENALIQGVILVVIVLTLALGNLRASLIVALSIPFSAALALIAMKLAGVSANLMSLGGITVALGMLVDGSIVVTENIIRHLEEPQTMLKNKFELITKAALEVSRPIAFALLIIIAVFIPVFMFEGVEGKMFIPLAFTIAAALGGSLIATVINVPALTSLLFSGHSAPRHRSAYFKSVIDNIYLPLLRIVIRRRGMVFMLTLFMLGGGLWVLARAGREFVPTLEEGSLMVTVAMAPSISLQSSGALVRRLEQVVVRHPQVAEVLSRIGRPEAGSHPHPVNFAEIQVRLKHPDNSITGRDARLAIVEALRAEMRDYPGVTMNFSQPIQNSFDELLSGTRAYFALKLYGEDLSILQAKAEEMRAAIAGIPGVVDLSVEQSYGQPQLQIIPDHQAMARFGVNAGQITRFVEDTIGGKNISAVYEQTRRYDINARIDEPFRSTPEQLAKLKLRTDSGRYVNLDQVAHITLAEGPVQINREKIQRRWTINGNVTGRAPSEIVRDMRDAIASKVELPPGYHVEFGGQFENQERAMKKLTLIIPLVLAIIFALLCMTFNSLRSSTIVMSSVPLSLIGGAAGLALSGQLLSVPAAVGFIALLGIAMQDAVVMVSDFNDLRRDGMPLSEAVFHGGALRFRAVILTTVTTLLGLFPLLLSSGTGAEIQKPLAVIVVSGLTSSTLFTLLVLPAIYFEVERRFMNRKKTVVAGRT